MNKKKILSFLSLVVGFTTVASITATVAWFNGAQFLQISSFVIKMSDKQLKVSDDDKDEESFEFSIDLETMESYVESFTPVSSSYHDVWVEEKSLMPKFTDQYGSFLTTWNYAQKETNTWAKEGTYYSQPLFFKCDTDSYLTIDTDPQWTYFEPDHEKNLAAARAKENDVEYLGKSADEIAAELDGVANSLRMSLLVLTETGKETDLSDYKYYIIDPHKELIDKRDESKGYKKTTYGGLLDLNEDGFFDSYKKYNSETESYENREVIYGQAVNSDKAVFSEPLGYDTEYLYPSKDPDCFNAKSSGSNYWFNEIASKEAGFEWVTEPSLSLKEAEENMLIPVTAGIPRKIVISLYLEGWDLDNINKTKDAHFKISISFKIAHVR
ncbi:MAG: hypothetical protein HUJ59_04940 [Bacilli bacterium]|nr:hypothetical protein [Bacilli bacterium]